MSLAFVKSKGLSIEALTSVAIFEHFSSAAYKVVYQTLIDMSVTVDFPLSRNFYVCTCVKFTFANKIEAMYERSHVRVKVKPRATSFLISTLHILTPLYLRD